MGVEDNKYNGDSMSSPNLGDILASALTSIVNAVAGIVEGVASAIAANANIIGTVLVIGGLTAFVVTQLTRAVPFVRNILGRFLAM